MVKAGVLVAEAGCWFWVSEREGGSGDRVSRGEAGERGGRLLSSNGGGGGDGDVDSSG